MEQEVEQIKQTSEEKVEVKQEINIQKQIEHDKFHEMVFAMNRKQRRNFAKASKIKWKNMPHFSLEDSKRITEEIMKKVQYKRY